MEPIIKVNATDCKYFMLQYYFTLVSHIQDGKTRAILVPFGKNFQSVDVFSESKKVVFLFHHGIRFIEYVPDGSIPIHKYA